MTLRESLEMGLLEIDPLDEEGIRDLLEMLENLSEEELDSVLL